MTSIPFELRSSKKILGGAALLAVLPMAALAAFPSQLNMVLAPTAYYLFHNLVEFFSIFVSLSVFGVGWFAYDQSRDRHALFLSAAMLVIGLLDLMHTLSYEAMPSFITPNFEGKSAAFWIVARQFEAFAFFVSAFIYHDTRNRLLAKRPLMLLIVLFLGCALGGIVLPPLHGHALFFGSSTFTLLQEYSDAVVILLLSAAVVAYIRRRGKSAELPISYYLAAFMFNAFGELNIAAYTRDFDAYNVLGHVYKVVAFALIYRGIFVSSVKAPYSKLAYEERINHLASFPQLNPNPVLEISGFGEVGFANPSAERVLQDLGYARSDLALFLPADLPDMLRDLEAKKESIYQREIRIKDRTYSAAVHLVPQFNVARMYAFDITERKRTESIMQARARILKDTTAAMSVDETLRMALDEIEIRTGSVIGFYHFLDADQETVLLQMWSTNTIRKMCSAEGKDSHYNIAQAGVWVDCIRERRPIIHNDYASLPHRKGLPPGHAPIHRELVVPILRNGRIMAIIGVGNKPSEYNAADIEMAMVLGDLSWEIIERKRAEQSLKKLNSELEQTVIQRTRFYSVLARINEAIVRERDQRALFGEVCRIMVEVGEFKLAWIGIVDPVSREVSSIASHGVVRYLDGLRIVATDVPEGRGPTGRAIAEGHRIINMDFEQNDNMQPWRERARQHGIRSSSSFPLRSGGRVTGALTLYSGEPSFFNDEELGLLESLMDDLSYAMAFTDNEQKRLDAEQRNTLTSDLLKLFTQKFTRREYLDEACGLLRDWSNLHHVGIRITEPDGSIPFESCRGYSESFLETENAISLIEDQCICTRIVSGSPDPADRCAMTPNGSFYSGDTGKFIEQLIGDARARYRGVCMKYGFNSLAVIPIRYRETSIGAIHLADERPDILNEETVLFLEQLSYIIGEAVFRFGIEDDLRKNYENLRKTEVERVRLASAVESTADAIVVTTPDTGSIQYVNPSFEQITGYSRQEALGKSLHMFESGMHDATFFNTIREALQDKGVWRGQLENRKKDGTRYFADCTFSPVRDEKGAIVNYVYMMRDITDKLRLESIAEAVNTMDSIGYVFTGVRHEIGNPINSAKMSLSVLQHKLDTASKEMVKDYVNRALGEIGRVEVLLKSLRNFNLYETPELVDLDVREFLGKFHQLIAGDFQNKGITVIHHIESDMNRVKADPRALQQILLNLIANSADALGDREYPTITLLAHKEPGRVLIQVRDNGQGMSEQQQDDLFKPFHTSKAQGTGLGLVIVKKMVSRMNGEISITSQQKIGTTVTILLPEGSNGTEKQENDPHR